MKEEKTKIGLIFCGGCNPYFDRENLYEEIIDNLSDRFDFYFFREGIEVKGGFVVIINNCPSECLMSNVTDCRSLLINNMNYREACRLIQKAAENNRTIQL